MRLNCDNAEIKHWKHKKQSRNWFLLHWRLFKGILFVLTIGPLNALIRPTNVSEQIHWNYWSTFIIPATDLEDSEQNRENTTPKTPENEILGKAWFLTLQLLTKRNTEWDRKENTRIKASGRKVSWTLIHALEEINGSTNVLTLRYFYTTMSTKVLLRPTSLFLGGGGFSDDRISLHERRICTNGWVSNCTFQIVEWFCVAQRNRRRGVWGRGGLPQIFNHPLPFHPNLWILYRREWNITNAVDFRRPWM